MAMASPLRVYFEDAIYHVTSRGNERKNIVRTDKDRGQLSLTRPVVY